MSNLVNQFAGPDFAEYSRTVLTWLLDNYTCTASNEEGTDLTAHLSWPGRARRLSS